MGRISYEKDQHETAKAKGHALVTFAVDGRYVKPKPFGSMTSWGPMPPDLATKFLRFWTEIEKAHQRRAKRAKKPAAK